MQTNFQNLLFALHFTSCFWPLSAAGIELRSPFQNLPSTGAVSSAASEAVSISGSIAVSIVGMVGDKIAFCVGYSDRCKKRRDTQEDLCATGRKA